MSKLSLAVEKAAPKRVPCPHCTYTAEPGSSIAGHVSMCPKRPGASVPALPDREDQRWLDAQVAAIESGVEAVIEIARNWTAGRNLSRLHPGSAAEYVTSRVGTLGKAVVPVLLSESNWSNRQIAAVAGVSHQTVGREAAQLVQMDQLPDDRPTLGADNAVRTYAPRTVTAVVIDTPPERPIPTPTERAMKVRAAAMQSDPDVAAAALQSEWATAMHRLAVLLSFDPAKYVPALDADGIRDLPGEIAAARRWLDSIESAHALVTRPRIVGGAS